MTMFQCDFCKKHYSSISSLNLHQKTTLKCLKIQENQGINISENTKTYNCEYCDKIFLKNYHLERHMNNCKYKNIMGNEYKILKEENEILKEENKELKEELDKIKKELNALKHNEERNAYKIKFKNEFEKLPKFTEENVKESLLKHLTINSIKGGEDQYINDFVDGIKNFIIVKDLARNKVITKDKDGKEFKTTSNKIVQQCLIFIKEEQDILIEQVKQTIPDFDGTNVRENNKMNFMINIIKKVNHDVKKEKTNEFVNIMSNKVTKESILVS